MFTVYQYCNLHLFLFFFFCLLSLCFFQAYTCQIVVMVMIALAIGSDKMSTLAKREAIIAGLNKLPGRSSKL